MSVPVESSLAAYARLGARRTAWPWALAGVSLGLAALATTYRSTALEMIQLWRVNPTYGYAWAVVPSLAYLLWHHRSRFACVAPAPGIAGIFAGAACGVVWLIAHLANLAVGREAALVAATICLVLAATGWKVFRQLAPFLALLLLLVPAGDLLIPPLKWLTVHTLATASALAAIPHSIDGNVLYTGSNRYVVIDDCAGLPILLSSLFLALTFGLLVYRSVWKIALFALLGIACGIATNGLRVLSIVAVDWVQGTQMDLSSHAYFEWLALALALGVLFAVLAHVMPEEDGPENATAQVDEGVGPRCFLAVSCAALLAVAIPQLAVAHVARQDASALLQQPESNIALPERLAQWTRRGKSNGWNPAPRLPIPHEAARYLMDGREFTVFVAASDVTSRKITGYSIDLIGPGAWREAKRDVLRSCTAGSCGNIQVLELLRRDSPDVRRVYYVYAIDGTFADTALRLQLRLAWARLFGARPTARLIALASDGKTVLQTEEIVQLFAALRRQMDIKGTDRASNAKRPVRELHTS